MRFFGKTLKPVFALTVLLLLFWANYNLTFYNHLHIDQDGRIIIHSHPFPTAERTGESTSTHTHTKSEFTFLASIYSILSTFLFWVLIVTLIIKILRELEYTSPLFTNIGDIFRNTVLRRGPPLSF
ncbi:MAG: hypothetical protein M0R34_11995 [Candidatus Marinimicrobia bacterium]|jgi:hypothetical protein|nr:hypothetical protein [Candidatus Neomarinimicrobiota bacterium]MDD5230767.1 hypothetical protein [Candidatus Neomarinimicrobiota bacterium]